MIDLSRSSRRILPGVQTIRVSATCLSETLRPVRWEWTPSVSILPTSCRSAATERRVMGISLSRSRKAVFWRPEKAVCSDRAMSSLVTPARRARAWLTCTSSFLVGRPQLSSMLRVPAIVRSRALTSSALAYSCSRSRPISLTSMGLFTGGP